MDRTPGSLDDRVKLAVVGGRWRPGDPAAVRSATGALGLAATRGAGAGVRTSLTLLLVRQFEKRGHRGPTSATASLLPAAWLLGLVVLAEDAADRNPTLRRIHRHLALPWRVAGGALAASTAASSLAALPGFALMGAASALLWQRAWRAEEYELERQGMRPGHVAVVENLSVLWLAILARRWPALGLGTVPVALCLSATARANKRGRYAALAHSSTGDGGADVSARLLRDGEAQAVEAPSSARPRRLAGHAARIAPSASASASTTPRCGDRPTEVPSAPAMTTRASAGSLPDDDPARRTTMDDS